MLRFKWVGHWSSSEQQFRLFRVMWERGLFSYKVSVGIKYYWLPWVTLRKGDGIVV